MSDWDTEGGGHQKIYGENAGGTSQPLRVEEISYALEMCSIAEAQVLAGNGVERWKNAVQPGAGTLVGTYAASGSQPGIYYNLSDGETVMLTEVHVAVETTDDWLAFEIGYTAGTAGGGAFTPVTPRHFVRTGSSVSFFHPHTETYHPSIRVAQSSGTAECITARLEANDASTEVAVGWRGYKVS